MANVVQQPARVATKGTERLPWDVEVLRHGLPPLLSHVGGADLGRWQQEQGSDDEREGASHSARPHRTCGTRDTRRALLLSIWTQMLIMLSTFSED